MTKVTITTMITAMTTMLEYDFMRNAFAAAGVAAVVSGLVGYFLVLRGQTFAGHALSHIGFAGATGAMLIGVASVWGLVGFTVAAAIGMGLLGERISGRDVAIGVVLALALGFGLLFLHYYTAFASQATALLFGNVLAVDRAMIGTLVGLGLVTLGGLAAIMRPLIFRELAAGTGRGQGRAAALCVHRLPDRRGLGRVGVRADRRHPPGLQPDGGAAGDGAAAGDRPVERHGALRGARSGRGLVRHCHCLPHRLAGQLLHRFAERVGLFP